MNRHKLGIIPEALALLGGFLYAFWVAAWVALIITACLDQAGVACVAEILADVSAEPLALDAIETVPTIPDRHHSPAVLQPGAPARPSAWLLGGQLLTLRETLATMALPPPLDLGRAGDADNWRSHPDPAAAWRQIQERRAKEHVKAVKYRDRYNAIIRDLAVLR